MHVKTLVILPIDYFYIFYYGIGIITIIKLLIVDMNSNGLINVDEA